MNEIVKKIFLLNLFTEKNVGNNKFFELSDEKTKKAVFWLVISVQDLDNVIKEQPNLFEECKKKNSNSAFDKNASLLVLWETNEDINNNETKKKIMSIEEDLFFFKKHVLSFSPEECNELQTNIGHQDLELFITTQISSQETFKNYKAKPSSKTWQSLLYRLIIKLSFVKINIEESDGPRSIYKANEDRLNKTGNEEIRNFADLYFEIMNSKDSAFLNKSTAEDMLTFLLPTLKGKSENAN